MLLPPDVSLINLHVLTYNCIYLGQNVTSTPTKTTMKDVLYPLSTICLSPILEKQHEGHEGTEANDEVENAQSFQEAEMTVHNERYTYKGLNFNFTFPSTLLLLQYVYHNTCQTQHL